MFQDETGNLPENLVIPLNERARFILAVKDLLSAPVDVIVSPANRGLAPGGGLAERILFDAGPDLEQECEQIIREGGMLEVTEAVMTSAGRLMFDAIVHAVGPRMGNGDEANLIQQTVLNAVGQVEKYNLFHNREQPLRSIAFPAISTGIFCVPREICAQAFQSFIREYQRSNRDTNGIAEIWLCVGTDDFPVFKRVLTADPEKDEQQLAPPVGQVELDEEDLASLEDDTMKDWFK